MELTITLSDNKLPKFAALLAELDLREQQEFFAHLSDDFEVLVSDHIRAAAASRHTTATRLGATPTGYLERASQTVEAAGVPGRISLLLQGDIFKRAFGPVTVTAKKAKMLTIPWRAEAYGRRAGEFDNLFVFTSKRGNAFLARRAGKSIEFMFLLKKSVVLPQDRKLLPSDAQFAKVVERAAQRHVDNVLKQLS